MPNPVLVAAGIGAGGSVIGAGIQAGSARRAADAQVEAAQLGVDEQRRQFDEVKKILSPYVDAGELAMDDLGIFTHRGGWAAEKQAALAGLGGPQEQQRIVNQIADSPVMEVLIDRGEQSILQRASATGGLRGGDTQAALAQFAPEMLAAEIDKTYARLGGIADRGANISQNIASLGQASAAGVGSAGMRAADSIANLYGDQGAARAGAAIASGNAWAQGLQGVSQSFGNVMSYMPEMPEGATVFSSWGF
jgi:hypothetical protein